MAYRIAKLTRDDVPAVHAIELVSNRNPWPPGAFRRELILPFSSQFVVTAENDASVLAFLIVWNVRGEVHILNVAVHPDYRRQGIATLLIEHALQRAREEGGESVYLEVRTSNEAAQALYESFGFERVGVRKKYYDDNEEDAVVMSVSLADEAAEL